jgi:DNA-binding transcriptional regulator GbsR (MarR family)
MAVDAVGDVIEFWGFKRNQGRVWGLLYLRGEAFTANDIGERLQLSKGAVSMLVRDLELWGVIQRERYGSEGGWRYRAETELVRMVTRVIEQREAAFITRIHRAIAGATELAEQAGNARPEQLLKLQRMNALADHTERALKLFIRTAKLDVGGMFGVFKDSARSLRRRGA